MKVLPQRLVDRMAERDDRKRYGLSTLEQRAELVARSEKLLRDQIESYLRRHDIYYILPRHDRKTTIRVGHPDFSIWHKNKWLLLELKAAGGTLSHEQKECIGHLARNGCLVHVVKTYSQALDLIQEL
jgi:hypothetical protein